MTRFTGRGFVGYTPFPRLVQGRAYLKDAMPPVLLNSPSTLPLGVFDAQDVSLLPTFGKRFFNAMP